MTGERYALVERIASGPSGILYLADDLNLNRRVAMKFPREDIVLQGELLSRLDFPGVVPIHDMGLLPNGRAFYTMKYLEGKSLADFIAEGSS